PEGPLLLDPGAIHDIQVLDRDILCLATRQEMLHEEVAARTVQPALPDFDTPEVVVELPPVFLIQLLRRLPAPVGAEEDVIAEQVGGKQRFPSRIQGLKDDLRVVGSLEIDLDDV